MTSLLFNFRPVDLAIEGSLKVSLAMGRFAGASTKQLILRGTAEQLNTLKEVAYLRKKSVASGSSSQLVHKKGKTFTGNLKELQKSSGYTRSFAVAVSLCLLGLSAEVVHQHLSALNL